MIFIFDSIVIILYLINGYLGAVAMTYFQCGYGIILNVRKY